MLITKPISSKSIVRSRSITYAIEKSALEWLACIRDPTDIKALKRATGMASFNESLAHLTKWWNVVSINIEMHWNKRIEEK